MNELYNLTKTIFAQLDQLRNPLSGDSTNPEISKVQIQFQEELNTLGLKEYTEHLKDPDNQDNYGLLKKALRQRVAEDTLFQEKIKNILNEIHQEQIQGGDTTITKSKNIGNKHIIATKGKVHIGDKNISTTNIGIVSPNGNITLHNSKIITGENLNDES